MEERIYSVTMTENELKLFSEFLEQKSFDNRDYETAENILRRASRGELSDPDREGYIGAASEWLAESSTKKDSIQKAIDEARANLTPENVERAEKFSSGYDKHMKDSDQIIDAKKKSIIDLNNLSKERNRRMNEILSEDPNKSSQKYNPKTRIEIDEDVPIITEPEEEDNDTLALADQVRFNEEQKKKLISGNENTGKKYDPKTDKPLVEINEDVPIITEPEEKERTKELNKFQRDRKREDFINKMKEVPGKIKNKYDSLSDKYSENFDGRSLGKDAAIAAGATAALSAGAYGLHKYLKKKKASKKKAEDKFKK